MTYSSNLDLLLISFITDFSNTSNDKVQLHHYINYSSRHKEIIYRLSVLNSRASTGLSCNLFNKPHLFQLLLSNRELPRLSIKYLWKPLHRKSSMESRTILDLILPLGISLSFCDCRYTGSMCVTRPTSESLPYGPTL